MGKIIISQSLSIHDEVQTKWTNMLGEVQIPETSNCPSLIKPTCEKILMMLLKIKSELDGSFPDYNTMSELDKILMFQYWREYDGFQDALCRTSGEFQEWFMKSATSTDLISRSRRFLCEHHAIFVKKDVAEHAQESGNRIRMGMRK